MQLNGLTSQELNTTELLVYNCTAMAYLYRTTNNGNGTSLLDNDVTWVARLHF